jgi:hypothetical protein
MMVSSFAALLLLSAQGTIDIRTDLKDGETITGERSIRVTVVSSDPVTQVEFYVGSDLRSSDTSTPYEFRIDSLAEEEGPLRLTVKAFTESGRSAERVYTLVIDNQLGRGLAYHLEQANAALAERNFAKAVTSGRIAAKIDPNSSAAKYALARANAGLNILDTAQKFAEDAATLEPANTAYQDFLASIYLRRAFRTTGRDASNWRESVASLRTNLMGAAQARKKALDAVVDRQTPTRENAVPFADDAIRAGRYLLAVGALQPAFQADNRNNAVANRLAYAQLRAGRAADAYSTMQLHRRFGSLDAYGYGLVSVLEQMRGQAQASDDAMKDALLTDANNLGVRTAQAYIALVRGRTNVLANSARELAREPGQPTEVFYYLSAVLSQLRQPAEAQRSFERAVLSEPANADAYIQRGLDTLGFALLPNPRTGDTLELLLETARAYFDTALVAQPSNSRALSGLVLVSLYQNKVADAIRLADSAVRAAPDDAAGSLALAVAQNEAAKRFGRAGNADASARAAQDARQANLEAGRKDPANLGDRTIAGPVELLQYINGRGRQPVLSLPRG